MTLWLLAVMPTFLPACTSSTIISAPIVLLPEPGGPWIGRVVWSSFVTTRRAAAAPVSPVPSRSLRMSQTDAWAAAQKQVARGAIWPICLDAVISNPTTYLEQALALAVRPGDVAWHQRGWMAVWMVGRP